LGISSLKNRKTEALTQVVQWAGPPDSGAEGELPGHKNVTIPRENKRKKNVEGGQKKGAAS